MSSPTAASPQPSPTVGIRGPHLLTLIALSAVSPLAINIVVPALPGLQRVFQADYATVQLALSLYLLTFALAQLIVGPLSDRYGRRPVILWGLVVFAIGSAMCVLAPSIEVLIMGRVVQALGGSAGIVLARAIVRDLHERDRAAAVIGYMTTGMAMAQMVGPAVGGLLDEKVGWQAIFWLLTGASVIVFGVCLTDLRETNRYRGQSIGISALITGYGTLLRHPVFVSHAATATFASAVYFAFMGGAPYIADRTDGPDAIDLWPLLHLCRRRLRGGQFHLRPTRASLWYRADDHARQRACFGVDRAVSGVVGDGIDAPVVAVRAHVHRVGRQWNHAAIGDRRGGQRPAGFGWRGVRIVGRAASGAWRGRDCCRGCDPVRQRGTDGGHDGLFRRSGVHHRSMGTTPRVRPSLGIVSDFGKGVCANRSYPPHAGLLYLEA